jgi:1-deoxy-D-xylulose-5-phosphate reductoisomerase
MTRGVIVLGSTGSIGRQALEVAAAQPERLRVTGLSAGTDLDGLCAQAAALRPRGLALESAADPEYARRRLKDAAPEAEVWVGAGSAATVSRAIEAEVVVNGIVGAAGLAASLATLERGARLALANKETLVIGAPLVRAALARGGGELVPVDSEHSAALQCLAGRPGSEVARLVVTASGGALRNHPDWRNAKPSEVLAHPVWAMGARITVDSATLFNKGLELIEACALFDLPWERVGAVLHPQAIVHALVTFTDGSTLVQAALPDMRLPIQLALSWPEHWEAGIPPIEPRALAGLSFDELPAGRHPAFEVAVAAGRRGGTAPCVVNAADETAVQAFLDGHILLGRVPELLAEALEEHTVEPVTSFEQLVEIDRRARVRTRERVMAPWS